MSPMAQRRPDWTGSGVLGGVGVASAASAAAASAVARRGSIVASIDLRRYVVMQSILYDLEHSSVCVLSLELTFGSCASRSTGMFDWRFRPLPHPS